MQIPTTPLSIIGVLCSHQYMSCSSWGVQHSSALHCTYRMTDSQFSCQPTSKVCSKKERTRTKCTPPSIMTTMTPPSTMIEFWPSCPLFLFFNMSIRDFQDASAQGTEGLAMKESKLIKVPLYGSHRV